MRVADHPVERAGEAAASARRRALGQHLRGQVDDGGVAAPLHPAQEAEGDVAGAAGHVDQPHARPGRQPVEQRVLPQPVHAEAHRVVHQVVLRRDRGEDAAAPARPSRPRARSRSRNGCWARASPVIGEAVFLSVSHLLISRREALTTAPARGGMLPELPEVETVRRGLEPVLAGTAHPARRGPPPRPALAVPAAHGRAADRRAGSPRSGGGRSTCSPSSTAARR